MPSLILNQDLKKVEEKVKQNKKCLPSVKKDKTKKQLFLFDTLCRAVVWIFVHLNEVKLPCQIKTTDSKSQ